MKQYGLPYMGSKSKIAEWIIDLLPAGRRFVDLFGGGFAMSHCALESGKFPQVFYNEINPLLVPLIRDAINGKYSPDVFKPEWISRDKFFELKEKDGYIKYIWSFGNKGASYMFGEQIRPWREAFFKAVFGDYSLFNKMDIHPPKYEGNPHDRRLQLAKWIKTNMQDCKAKYIKYFIELIDNKKREFGDVIVKITDVKDIIKEEKVRLQTYLREALAKSRVSANEVDKHCGCHMSGHWFGNTQWTFPTFEMYKKMREIMPALDKDYFEITNYMIILQSLERLERLERLEIHTGSYLDYEYKEGDVVYCDPPYENTAKYCKEGFNHKEFYDWVASRPYTVFFSSYDISDNRFYVVDEKEKRSLLCATSNSKKVMEKVYCNMPGHYIKQKQLELF